MHGDATPGRLRGAVHPEVLLVLGVHLGEILHVGQEDGGFDDTGDVGAGGGEDGADVGDAEGGFVGEGAGGEVAGGEGGQLAGDVEGVGG